jgi:hypothetical protein
MDSGTQDERELRAARNQTLFRAVNEQMKELNQAFASMTERFAIACECADTSCVEMLRIDPKAYEAVRANPRYFAVLPGHVHPDVERVVEEPDGYVVVEKVALAAKVAEQTAD